MLTSFCREMLFFKKSLIGLSGLNYTDGLVVSGATYLYVVAAVDAQGVESAYSGSASAVIP